MIASIYFYENDYIGVLAKLTHTTISDIAKALRTTPATVPGAMNNHPSMSIETKEAVKLTATRLNYKKNRLASSSRSGKTFVNDVIIPKIEVDFFGSIVHGIESIANAHGYNILIYQSDKSPEFEIKVLETFMTAQAHLAGQQHFLIFKDRLKGYATVLARNGFDVKGELIFLGNLSVESGREATTRFLSLADKPDALFAVEYLTAPGVIKECRKREIKIPQRMGVFGFACQMFDEHITSGLSIIDQQTVINGRKSHCITLRYYQTKAYAA